MRRKRKPEEQDSPDRWVVSYADFITLLFAFFTTLYAISHVDLGKLERFTGSMKTAFKAGRSVVADTAVIDGFMPVDAADIGLEKDLREETKKFDIIEGIVVSRDGRGVVLTLADVLLFESGSAEVKSAALPLIANVASLIKKTRRMVVIEGHTDNIPLRNPRYASNVELSAARAANVFSVLVGENLLGPERISTAGYGEYRPAASNATPGGRARNRRIDIIFVARKDGA